MLKILKGDLKKIEKWGIDKNPFKAIKDFTQLKANMRWENSEHRKEYMKTWIRRKKMSNNKNVQKYYSKTKNPIDSKTWNYLRLRKPYYITPLGWDNIAKNGGNIIDVGCGDGDVIQNLIDFIINYWKKNKVKKKIINIFGLDLNKSRIDNAKKFVNPKTKLIKVNFLVKDLTKKNLNIFKKNYFNYCICTGVMEMLDDNKLNNFLNNIKIIVSKGIYIEDLLEKFPGGFPRNFLGHELYKIGFKTKKIHLLFTEPFSKTKLTDPKKICPIMIVQNIYAEKC